MAQVQQDTSIEWKKIDLTVTLNGEEIVLALTRLFTKISMIETIENKLIQGAIQFRDPDNYFANLQLVGDEKIEFSFIDTESEEEYELEFKCISWKQDPFTNDAGGHILLDFIDPEYRAFTNEYSTSFKDKKISEFMSDFSKNVLNKEIENKNMDETDEKKTLAFPYQKFSYMVTYLNQYAKNKNGQVYYIYYSDMFKTHYKTLSNMVSQEATMQFVETTATTSQLKNKGYFNSYILENKSNIMEANLNRGFGSTLINWDAENKEPVNTPAKYSEALGDEKQLAKYSLHDKKNDNAKQSFYYSASKEETNFKNKISIIHENFINGISITISLRGKFERRCGEVANVTFVDKTPEKEDENVSLDGNYLVTTIEHEIGPSIYTQHMELVRTGNYAEMSGKEVSFS